MSLQVAGINETFGTQRTLVRFLSCVDSHVNGQMSRLTECLVAKMTFVLSAVNSAVRHKVGRLGESFAANSTLERSSSVVGFDPFVAVHGKFVSLQMARIHKTFATRRTFIRLLTRVDSHMTAQISRLTERLVADETSVWFLSTVNPAVQNQLIRTCESFATHGTFERFLARMTSRMCCQMLLMSEAFSAFCALIFTSVNIHVDVEGFLRWKTSLAFVACIPVYSGECFTVVTRKSFGCKPFLMWVLRVITVISFTAIFTCIIHTT